VRQLVRLHVHDLQLLRLRRVRGMFVVFSLLLVLVLVFVLLLLLLQ
jgi:hypothetical protein